MNPSVGLEPSCRQRMRSHAVACCHILSHTVPAKAVSVSLTVPVAGEAINLVQSGVGFAHGVQFRMSEGALLSQTHGEGGHPKKKGKSVKSAIHPRRTHRNRQKDTGGLEETCREEECECISPYLQMSLSLRPAGACSCFF